MQWGVPFQLITKKFLFLEDWKLDVPHYTIARPRHARLAQVTVLHLATLDHVGPNSLRSIILSTLSNQ